MAAVYAMRSGIPSNEKPFWDTFSVEQLYAVYLSLNATPAKVLSLLIWRMHPRHIYLNTYSSTLGI